MPPNIVAGFLEKLRAQRESDEGQYRTPPQPAWFDDKPTGYDLAWTEESQLTEHSPPKPLAEVRAEISREILRYAESQDSRLLLIRVPPGVGKTTAAVEAAQTLSQTGRVLYAGPRHSFFGDVMGTRDFDHRQWYEWLPYAHRDGEYYTMCRYAPEMMAWLNRGYQAIELCKGLCQHDRYLSGCPYRLQAKKRERIIFGMHQHLTTGMAISDYWMAFCDEMPLGAFLKRHHIPRKSILIPGCSGALKELIEALDYLSGRAVVPLWGPQLFREIGNLLSRVYEEQKNLGEQLPQVPILTEPSDVYELDYWYIQDLLLALSPEYECWKNGWTSWISRVKVSRDGLLMLSRNYAKDKWSKMCPLVCLDATGTPEMYKAIFGRDVLEYAPMVARPGRIFQVVGRLNGMGRSLEPTDDGRKLSKKGRQMLDAAKLIKDQYPDDRVAAITFKAAEPEFEAVFGTRNVRHFGDVRGTNDLESAKALIVAGGYCPNVGGVFDLAASLFPGRMESFVKEDGNPPWARQLCEYRMREPDSRGFPVRDVSGFWKDPDLSIILNELRRNEITQAMHRVRPNLQASDVWLLTSLPTDEPLDEIFPTLSDVSFTPDRAPRVTKTGTTYYQGVTWEKWLLLREWLDDQWEAEVEHITKDMLADAAGVKVNTVRSQKWIAYLDRFIQDHGSRWAKAYVRIGNRNNLTWILARQGIEHLA